MIQLSDVTYTYPQTKKPALQAVSFTIPEGQFCAIVGGNGAGKSTLSYVLSGFIPHHFQGKLSGEVHVAGLDVPRTPLADLAGAIGLVFSNPFNQITGARFTVQEEIAFGLENLGVPREEMLDRVAEVMTTAGLSGLEERSPLALSGGQQQRVALAAMLVLRPRVLVLDEPTSQLDPLGKKEVFRVLDRLVRERNMTVVLIEQELEWIATYADRVLVLHEGRLTADGDPQRVLSDETLLAQGVGNTTYTQVAREAQQRGLLGQDGEGLPVTLEQAAEFFTADDAPCRGEGRAVPGDVSTTVEDDEKR